MKTIRKIAEKKFSLDQFLLMALCFVVLVGLTVVSLSGPLLQKLDDWMNNLQHQVYTFIGVFLILAGSWVFWTIKRWR